MFEIIFLEFILMFEYETIINCAMMIATTFMAVATFLSVNEMKKTRKE